MEDTCQPSMCHLTLTFYFYFYQILNTFNKLNNVSEIDNWKTIYRFHKLVFDKWDSSIDFFNRATQNYELPVPVRYRTRGELFCLLLRIESRDNVSRWVHVPWLSQGLIKPVLFLEIVTFSLQLFYFFIFLFFLHHE